MYELTNDQVDSFHQKGWIGPLDTFSVQEVESVKKDLEAISQVEVVGDRKIRRFENPHFGMKTTQHHHLHCKPLSALFEDKRVVSRLNQLGESDLLLLYPSIWKRQL